MPEGMLELCVSFHLIVSTEQAFKRKQRNHKFSTDRPDFLAGCRDLSSSVTPHLQSGNAMHDLEISVISLRSAEQRRQYMVEQLSASPLRWSLFDALTGPHPATPYSEQLAIIHNQSPLTKGELGCFGSHFACMAEFVEKNTARYRLIIEDDVYLDPTFWFTRLPTLMEACGLDYLRLYSRALPTVKVIAPLGQRHLIRLGKGPNGTQAYVISQAGARAFLASVRQISRPVDKELDRYWYNGLAPYAIYPYPALEFESQTTVKKSFGAAGTASPMQRIERFLVRSREKIRREQVDRALKGRDLQVAHAARQWWSA